MKFTYNLINSSELVNFAFRNTDRECLKMTADDGSYLVRDAKYPFSVLENALSEEIDDYLANSGPFPAPVSTDEMGCDEPSDLAVKYAVHHLISGETEFAAFVPGESREIVRIGNVWMRVSGKNSTVRVDRLA